MRARLAMAAMAAAIIGVSLPAAAAEQVTIFTTKDFRQDRALWTNPAYYKNNSLAEFRGMGINIVPYETGGQVGSSRLFGSEGTGKPGATNLASPYPFKTAEEHYQAWLKDAKGGTKHTKDTIPDWSGRWTGGPNALNGGAGPASDVVKILKPPYQEHLVQELKATSEGRTWWPQAFCLPVGFYTALSPDELIVTPARVWTLGSGNGQNTIRWIYTDGSGHTPKATQFPKWHGESVGFWNGDTLIVHTNQIKAWKAGLMEFSDNLETVEKYRRVGDRIEGEITMYDPDVFVGPIYSKVNFTRNTDTRPERRPLYSTCTDTNGPSPKVFLDADGFTGERLTGDPNDPIFTWDETDPRPWGTWLDESDKRYKAYLARGGKPPTPGKPGER